MTLLLDLSNELLLQISRELGHERNINALSRTNRRLYFLLRNFLIQYNVWNYESSALLWAGRHGDEDLARKVLAEGGTAQVTGCQWPWSPLTLAVANEHENLVHLFLNCEDLDINWSSKNDCRTALSLAAERGNFAIVETLLIMGRANPNKNFGEPVALSCENGHQPIVEIFLRQDAIDLRPIIYNGLTSLSRAASKGHLGIAKLLLETAHVDPNDEEQFDHRTPFFWAAWMGHTDVVELLLAQNDVVPDKTYDMNRTPLSLMSFLAIRMTCCIVL